MSITQHEAGHAVAAFCLGQRLEEVAVWAHGEGLTRTEKPTRPILGGDPNDILDCAIVLLAGEHYLRSIGQAATGGNGDFAKAAFLIRETFETLAAARQGFDIVLEATQILVGSERFQALAAALVPKLERQAWHYGPDVERFLREHDADGHDEVFTAKPRREFHSPSGPWYEVTAHGSLVARGTDWSEGKAIARRTPGSLIVGSSA